ncbi:3912_t:CDS:2 [Entrophospora sp. SA101]|nr:57_t:CDS:2 [Entrophospora sp. SA101]CAJ0754077.1 3912_t:CDS:2 [Entrophospora sp. SA101]
MDIQGDGTKNMNGSIGDLEDKNDKNDDECGNLDIWEIDDDDYLDNDTQQNQKQDNELVTIDTEEII